MVNRRKIRFEGQSCRKEIEPMGEKKEGKKKKEERKLSKNKQKKIS